MTVAIKESSVIGIQTLLTWEQYDGSDSQNVMSKTVGLERSAMQRHVDEHYPTGAPEFKERVLEEVQEPKTWGRLSERGIPTCPLVNDKHVHRFLYWEPEL